MVLFMSLILRAASASDEAPFGGAPFHGLHPPACVASFSVFLRPSHFGAPMAIRLSKGFELFRAASTRGHVILPPRPWCRMSAMTQHWSAVRPSIPTRLSAACMEDRNVKIISSTWAFRAATDCDVQWMNFAAAYHLGVLHLGQVRIEIFHQFVRRRVGLELDRFCRRKLDLANAVADELDIREVVVCVRQREHRAKILHKITVRNVCRELAEAERECGAIVRVEREEIAAFAQSGGLDESRPELMLFRKVRSVVV